MRSEILGEIGAILRDHLAGAEWGRALVEVVRASDGEPVVAGIEVEEVIGDEARVDAVFEREAALPVLPVLAKATEALCGLAGVALEDVQGGTFLRLHESRFEWLPGLVHAPSPTFDRAWDAVVANLDDKRSQLEKRFRLGGCDRYDVDVERETIVFSSGGEARVIGRATVIGSFAAASRAWGWGGYNGSLPERVRVASASLIDEILDRDMWELSTPVFPTDEPTAWALAAFVCDRANGQSVYATRSDAGLVFLLLRDVHEQK